MLKFYVEVYYVMGKASSGELSCPCDRSCFYLSEGMEPVKCQGKIGEKSGNSVVNDKWKP